MAQHKSRTRWPWLVLLAVGIPAAVAVAAKARATVDPKPDPGNPDGLPLDVAGKSIVTKVALQQAEQAGELSKRPLNLSYALEPGDEVVGYRWASGYRVTKRNAPGVAWFQLADTEIAEVVTTNSVPVPIQCIRAPCNLPGQESILGKA